MHLFMLVTALLSISSLHKDKYHIMEVIVLNSIIGPFFSMEFSNPDFSDKIL